jgi:acyl carrier protein
MWFSKKNNRQSVTALPTSETAPTSSSALDWLRASVSRISRDHVPVESIDVRAHLLDSGYIDSLSSTELLTDIERRFGVRIEEMDIVGRLCNLEALAREIESRAAQ